MVCYLLPEVFFTRIDPSQNQSTSMGTAERRLHKRSGSKTCFRSGSRSKSTDLSQIRLQPIIPGNQKLCAEQNHSSFGHFGKMEQQRLGARSPTPLPLENLETMNPLFGNHGIYTRQPPYHVKRPKCDSLTGRRQQQRNAP